MIIKHKQIEIKLLSAFHKFMKNLTQSLTKKMYLVNISNEEDF